MEFVCFVWISEQTANLALHHIKILVFITEVESFDNCTVHFCHSPDTHSRNINTIIYTATT